jgi:nucleoside-diphosphate-sugar epimerase
MTRVLVTGASGFIGPHLVRLLTDQGVKVTCLVRNSSDLSRLESCGPEFVYGDLLNLHSLTAAISECDVVYHIAGLTKSVPSEVMWQVNELGVRNVAQACANRRSPPVLVVLSSMAAAGPAPRERPLTESDPPKPVSKYGLSKLKGESAAFEFAERVPISIVRAPIVFGEGDLDGLALFLSIAKTRFHMVPTIRNYRYSFIHAKDLGKAMLLIAKNGDRISPDHANKGIYFVAAEQNPTYADYGRMIGKALGVRLVVPCPNLPATIRLLGAGSELYARVTGKAQIMNWDKTREALAGSWACSAERLNAQLGFRTEKPLPDRLSQTVQWYVQQGHLQLKTSANQSVDATANATE